MEQTFNHCSFPNPASPASLLRPAHIHIQLELTHSLSSLPAGAGYPYVFLNDEPFSQEFKKYTQELTSAECFYGLIEPSHWNQPDWIDEEKATAARNDMIEKKVIYGHSVPYRNSQCDDDRVRARSGTDRSVALRRFARFAHSVSVQLDGESSSHLC